jgi:hypothetical protein
MITDMFIGMSPNQRTNHFKVFDTATSSYTTVIHICFMIWIVHIMITDANIYVSLRDNEKFGTDVELVIDIAPPPSFERSWIGYAHSTSVLPYYHRSLCF